MTSAVRCAAVLLCLCMWGLTPVYVRGSDPVASQQPRDNRIAVNPTGTGVISGVVVTAERVQKPVRRARVLLTGSELSLGQTTITADDGTFTFAQLPPGRYGLTATKDGYVSFSFGATAPNRPGTRIVLAAGGHRSVSLALSKGAVITGILTSDDGQPVVGVSVLAMSSRYLTPPGERRLVALENLAAVTDDRGVYRIYGLPAGEYTVMAQLRRGPSVDFGGELEEISPAEVRRALSEVSTSYRAPSRPGPPPAPPAAPVVAEPRRSVAFAPVFYPGTAVMAQARTIELTAAEERRGVDFVADYVPTATVQGYVTLMDGGPPPKVPAVQPAPLWSRRTTAERPGRS